VLGRLRAGSFNDRSRLLRRRWSLILGGKRLPPQPDKAHEQNPS